MHVAVGVRDFFLEVHENYAHEVERLVLEHGLDCHMRKDMQGKYRMVRASAPGITG
jgi:hypothetical protein